MREYTVRKYDMEDYDIGRDRMTIAETITLLERIDRGWIPDYNYTGEEDDYENYLNHVAIRKAIKAFKDRLKEGEKD